MVARSVKRRCRSSNHEMSEDKEKLSGTPDSSAWVDKTTNDLSVWVADINVVNHDLGLRQSELCWSALRHPLRLSPSLPSACVSNFANINKLACLWKKALFESVSLRMVQLDMSTSKQSKTRSVSNFWLCVTPIHNVPSRTATCPAGNRFWRRK